MSLFLLNKQAFEAASFNPLMVNTPLGKLCFDCVFAKYALSTIKPQNTVSVKSNVFLSSWSFDDCLVECLCVDYIPELPEDMHVIKAMSTIWRLHILRKGLTPKLTVQLDANSSLETYPESGENLAAMSYEDTTTKLTIGTEDEECLNARATKDDWLPTHFEHHIGTENILYTQRGLEIILPTCNQNDRIQIHFNTAWSSKETDPLSSWYAVDQPISSLVP